MVNNNQPYYFIPRIPVKQGNPVPYVINLEVIK